MILRIEFYYMSMILRIVNNLDNTHCVSKVNNHEHP